MAFPGPALPLWGAELVLYALIIALIGEAARSTLARWVALLRRLDPIERGLTDLYLGGAALYLVGILPLGLFDPVLTPALLLAVALASLTWGLHRRAPAQLRANSLAMVRTLRRPAYLLTAGVALLLLAIELSAVDGVASGNTYDASLFSLYDALANLHHQLPSSLAPFADQALAYPQGSTAWFAVAQGLFAVPPVATSLLVTPLFFALAPLGGFVVGRRLLGSEWSGAAAAMVFALAAPWTRGLVQGSNDFVLAFPLVLLLVAWSGEWLGSAVPTYPEALFIGGLLGYAAALNPVGPLWVLVSWPVAAVLARPRWGGAVRAWWTRWVIAALAAIPWVLPSLLVTVTSQSASAGGVGSPLGPGGHAFGFSAATWVGQVDPFLFRPQDEGLSPFPILRAELALLLLVGAVILLWASRAGPSVPVFARFVLGGGVVALLMAGVPYPAALGIPGFVPLAAITSAAEFGQLLFTLYALVAVAPLAMLLGAPELPELPARPRFRPPAGPHVKGWGTLARPWVAGLVVIVLLLPGAVITTTEMPGYLHGEYARFSDITAADLDLLTWSADHLPVGARVLAAPGSAAQFLPAYDAQVALVFPMTLGFLTTNASYWTAVNELDNGTLDGAGWTALTVLNVPYIAVTQANTALFTAFDPQPLIAAGSPVLFHEGDAYLFGPRMGS